jgi:hypothetical protein
VVACLARAVCSREGAAGRRASAGGARVRLARCDEGCYRNWGSAYRAFCSLFHGEVGNDALAGEDEMEQEDGSEERSPVQRRG